MKQIKHGDYTIAAEKQVDTKGTNGRYIAFDMFLQVNSETAINLTTNSNVVAVGASKGLENAARVALLNQGNVAPRISTSNSSSIK